MSLLNKIFNHLTVVLTLVAFTISTTGFTTYNHSCSHHEPHKSIIENDDCCDELANEIIETQSCCTVQQTCHTEDNTSSCCDTELEYNKLSQFFVQSEIDPQIDCPNQAISENITFSIDETLINEKADYPITPILKKPKKKIYLLFSQFKTEPPLI